MTQPVRLFLIRHGNTFNRDDLPVMVGKKTDLSLTQAGLEQAQHLSKYFVHNQINIHRLYCGNLTRQKQTAQAIMDNFPNLKSEAQPAFDEIDYGEWEGLTVEEVAQRWPDDFKRWGHQASMPPQFNENEFDKKQSMLEWIEYAKKHLAGKNVAVCTSQGSIKLFLSLFPDTYQSESLEQYRVKTGHLCEVELGQTLTIHKWNYKPNLLEDLA